MIGLEDGGVVGWLVGWFCCFFLGGKGGAITVTLCV